MTNKIEDIATAIREQIKSGQFGTRGRLPSVSELARIHHAGRSTVYDALQILQAEGLVHVASNSFYVNEALRVATTGATPTFEVEVSRQGATPFVRNIIDPEIVIMPADVAAMFRVTSGVSYVHRYRVQGKTDRPLRLSEYWYPVDLAQPYMQQMKDEPGFDTLEAIKTDLGIVHQLVHDDVLARIPTREEANLLAIPRNSPVQEVRRTNRAPSGEVLMHHRIVFMGPYSILGYDYELGNSTSNP